MLEQGTLAGIRIEGQARARYVDLIGEVTENDRILVRSLSFENSLK